MTKRKGLGILTGYSMSCLAAFLLLAGCFGETGKGGWDNPEGYRSAGNGSDTLEGYRSAGNGSDTLEAYRSAGNGTDNPEGYRSAWNGSDSPEAYRSAENGSDAPEAYGAAGSRILGSLDTGEMEKAGEEAGWMVLEPQATEARKEEQPGQDGSGQAPQIALSFDDGPHPVYTGQLLDGLRERGVTATFFVLGENIEGNESLLERMRKEGHLIGNHTYHHVKLDSLGHEEAVKEIRKTSDLVETVTGRGTEFIRPPFGIWSKSLEYDVTMLPAMWNIDTLDWTTKNVPATVGKVMDQAADQDIILFHDCYASSVEAALRTVDLLQEQGYEFVTVDRIILPP